MKLLAISILLCLTLPQGNSKFFGQQWRRRQARQEGRSYQAPCMFLFPKLCQTPTTTTTTATPPWNEGGIGGNESFMPPWNEGGVGGDGSIDDDDLGLPPFHVPPPVPTPSKQVNFLEVAETCAANFITQDYKENWEQKHDDFKFGKQWDIRLTSKLFVYLMAFNMYETNGLKITENQLEKSSCFLTTTINSFAVTNTTGFGDKSFALRMIRTSLPKVFRFSLPYGPIGAATGTASIILSDNDSYNVIEFCLDNGLRSFAMFAKGPVLNELEAVKLHLRALGYKEKNFIDLDPINNCEGLGLTGSYTPKTGYYDLPEITSIDKNILKFFNNNALLPVPGLFWKKK